MPRTSPRSRSIQESPIRKLAPLARAAEQRGTRVIYLNIGQPDHPSPGPMLDALRNLPLKRLAYAPSEGLPEAREAWSAFFASWGIAFEPGEILVTTGASEAITFALGVIAGGGGEVLVFEPCYTNYLSFAAQADVHCLPVPLRVEDAYHFNTADRLERRITSTTRGIIALQPLQPDRHGLHRRRARGGGAGGGEARPVGDRRRGLPGVRVRRPAGAQLHPLRRPRRPD